MVEGAVRLRLLGPVQVERDGEPVGGFRSRKALALLGYLAVQGGPVPRERLVDLLWEDKTETQGRTNLSWVLGRISSLLPGLLQADRHTVHFHCPPDCWLDVHAFEELEAQGDLDALAGAVGLYRGDFLEGLRLEGCAEFELWVVGERERWRQRVAGVLEELVAHHSRRGEYEEGLRFGRQLLALEPWREEAHRQVMRLLVQSGQRGAALAQYETCRQALAEELGLEPAEETKSLYERIRLATLGHADLVRVPAPPTRLIGREEELGEIVGLLADPVHRLVTLVGPGGIGKTHLALQAAREMGESGMFLEGVVFVPLGAVASPDLLVSAIAEALEFSFYESTDPREQLLNYLQSKEMLLVLDSFEHLLGGASLLADILARAPEVKLLVTSRERLNLQAEWLLEIGGLPFPAGEKVEGEEDYGAVKLFVHSARRVRREFTASEGEMGGVVRVCRLVEGMPLGILLAAAWVRTLSAAEIATEISGSVGFLEADLRDLPARQRSMRAAFDHSWRLLTEGERGVFRGLSVFRGGFTREAAEEVTGASLRALKALVDKSLLQRDADGRYAIHELLRQYGAEKLEEVAAEQETRDRHCVHYVGFLQERKAQLIGRDQVRALAEIGAEIENVRAAWDWAVDRGKIEELDRSLESLAEFYWMRAWYQEGEEAFAGAAQRLAGMQEEIGGRESRMVLGKALLQQGRFCDDLGRVEKARELLQESLAIFSDLNARREMAYCLFYVAEPAFSAPERGPIYKEALTIFEEVGDRRGVALSLRGLGWLAHTQGEYEVARQFCQESLAILRQLGNQGEIIQSLSQLGYAIWVLGEYRAARQLHQECLALCREIGNQANAAVSLQDLARDACGLGEYEEGKRLYQESLALCKEIGYPWGIDCALGDLGEVANVMGEYREAIRLAQEDLALCEKLDTRLGMAWSLRVLGNAACGLADFGEARRCLHQALEIAATEYTAVLPLTLTGIATLLAAEGEKEHALELLVLVNHHPASWQWAKDRAAPVVAELEAELPADAVARAKERGRARDLDVIVAELLVELGE